MSKRSQRTAALQDWDITHFGLVQPLQDVMLRELTAQDLGALACCNNALRTLVNGATADDVRPAFEASLPPNYELPAEATVAVLHGEMQRYTDCVHSMREEPEVAIKAVVDFAALGLEQLHFNRSGSHLAVNCFGELVIFDARTSNITSRLSLGEYEFQWSATEPARAAITFVAKPGKPCVFHVGDILRGEFEESGLASMQMTSLWSPKYNVLDEVPAVSPDLSKAIVALG